MKVVGVGAMVAVTTLIAGPFLGGVVMTIGTAALLTRFTDSVSNAAGQLTSATAR